MFFLNFLMFISNSWICCIDDALLFLRDVCAAFFAFQLYITPVAVFLSQPLPWPYLINSLRI